MCGRLETWLHVLVVVLLAGVCKHYTGTEVEATRGPELPRGIGLEPARAWSTGLHRPIGDARSGESRIRKSAGLWNL